MDYPFNPTSKEQWSAQPNIRNAYKTMVPLTGNNAWAQALGPTHFSWMFLDNTPKGLPKVEPPDVWFVYRTNPAISFWDTPGVAAKIARFPFIVAFAYTRDESNHFADVLLPDATDLEGLQLLRLAATKYQEQFWDTKASRCASRWWRRAARRATSPTSAPSWRGAAASSRSTTPPSTAAPAASSSTGLRRLLARPKVAHGRDAIWDAACKAASAELTEGAEVLGLDWWKENGLKTRPFPREQWYLYPTVVERGPALRDALPGTPQAHRRAARPPPARGRHALVGQAARGIPGAAAPGRISPACGEASVAKAGGEAADYPFWLVTARSMQYAWGGNVGVQMIREVAGNISGHGGVVMNPRAARAPGAGGRRPVEIATPRRATKGHVVLRQGIRPDTLLLIGQFDHWVTPLAKDFGVPSLNTLAEMSLDLTDATGSGADLVRVKVSKGTRRAAGART